MEKLSDVNALDDLAMGNSNWHTLVSRPCCDAPSDFFFMSFTAANIKGQKNCTQKPSTQRVALHTDAW